MKPSVEKIARIIARIKYEKDWDNLEHHQQLKCECEAEEFFKIINILRRSKRK